MLYYDLDGKPFDLLTERQKYEECAANKTIGYTTLSDGTWISTVWLGSNHNWLKGPPLIFETMVFPKDSFSNMDCERYSTKEEALLGHQAMVKKWKKKK